MSTRSLHIIAFASLIFAALFGPDAARAQQAYPNRVVRIIVPYSAGTGVDILTRTVGRKLSERFGQPVVVDNRPGASGNIGIIAAAKSAPDGYTLLMVVNTFAMNPALTQAGYDPVGDFSPVGLVGRNGMLLVVNPSVPARSVKELIAYARANPGKLNYASVGVGSPQHLSMELVKNTFGVDLVHVPHKGAAEANLAVTTGQVDVMMMPVNIALTPLRAGKIIALAVGSEKRLKDLPDLVPLAEQGAPGFDVDIWYAFLAPAGTPGAIVERLYKELNEVLREPDTVATLSKLGINADPMAAPEFTAFVKREFARWQKLIRDANIKAE